MLSKLNDTSNILFSGFKTKRVIAEELKYFTFEYKRLGKMYLLWEIHKKLSDVHGRSVISNCGIPTEQVSELLDYHPKPA